jgi:hypothetical protein
MKKFHGPDEGCTPAPDREASSSALPEIPDSGIVAVPVGSPMHRQSPTRDESLPVHSHITKAASSPPARKVKTCTRCHASFSPQHKAQRFCGPECRRLSALEARRSRRRKPGKFPAVERPPWPPAVLRLTAALDRLRRACWAAPHPHIARELHARLTVGVARLEELKSEHSAGAVP